MSSIYRKLPDGRLAEFPEGTPDSVIDKALAPYFQPTIKSAEQVKKEQADEEAARSAASADRLKRSLGLTGRNAIEGVMGGLTALPNYVANTLTGSDYFHNPGKDIADRLGLPSPESNAEKFAHAVTTGGMELATPGGIVNGIGKAGSVVSKVAPNLSKFLFEAPTMQGVVGAASSGATEGLRQGGASPAVQTAAGIGAGAVIPGLLGVIGRGGMNVLGGVKGDISGVFNGFTEEGRKRLAGRLLRDAAGDMDAPRIARLSEAETAPLITGSDPTLGQIAQNGGISALERVMESRGLQSGKFADRRAAQRDAQQALANEVGETVATRMAEEQAGINAAMPQGRDATTVGPILRDSYDRNYRQARADTSQAYESVDPNNETQFVLDPLVEQFKGTVGDGKIQQALVPQKVKNYVGILQGMAENGETATWRDLQTMRSDLSDLGYEASVSGDMKTKRVAEALKRQLDDYIERLAGNDVDPQVATVKPGSKAYKEARAIAREQVAADPLTEDISWVRNLGLDRAAAERLLSKDEVREMSKIYPGMFRNNGKRITDLGETNLSRLGLQTNGQGAMDEDVIQRLADLILDGETRTRSRINQTTQDLLDSASAGSAENRLTPEQVGALRIAKNLRRQQGQDFERGANLRLSRKGSTQYGQAVDDSAIPGLYFRKGPGGQEAMDAFHTAHVKNAPLAEEGAPTALSALGDYATYMAGQAAMGRGNFDPVRSARFRRDYGPALQAFPDLTEKLQALESAANGLNARSKSFSGTLRRQGDNYSIKRGADIDDRFGPRGNNTYTEEELDKLKALQLDQQRMARNTALGAISGSPTARNLAGNKQAYNAVTPFLGRIPYVGNLLNGVVDGMNQKTLDEVQRGLLSPQYGASLMRQAGKSRTKLGDGINIRKSGRDTARGAVGGGILSEMEKDDKDRRKKK